MLNQILVTQPLNQTVSGHLLKNYVISVSRKGFCALGFRVSENMFTYVFGKTYNRASTRSKPNTLSQNLTVKSNRSNYILLGAVHKIHPQSGGRGCPVRTFCGQGRRGFFRSGMSALFR